MKIEPQLRQLETSAAAIQAMVQGFTDAQVRWKPDPESWSVLEVINHLYDEEREDFREHLDLVLHRPDDPWSSIDPEGWVEARAYNTRDPQESLDNFLRERRRSLDWLAGLSNPDWGAAYEMRWGRIQAGDLLVSWVSHDVLHLRQLVELRWAIATRAGQPFSGRYAGVWGNE